MAVPMRPLSCAEAREEAARRIFEPLEPHTAATLDAHLAICHDCREQVQDMEHAARLLRSTAPPRACGSPRATMAGASWGSSASLPSTTCTTPGRHVLESSR